MKCFSNNKQSRKILIGQINVCIMPQNQQNWWKCFLLPVRHGDQIYNYLNYRNRFILEVFRSGFQYYYIEKKIISSFTDSSGHLVILFSIIFTNKFSCILNHGRCIHSTCRDILVFFKIFCVFVCAFAEIGRTFAYIIIGNKIATFLDSKIQSE